jgi:hypothetical protein
VVFDDGDPEGKEPAALPPGEVIAAAPLTPARRIKGQRRGAYGAQLSKIDRDTLINSIKGGATFTAAAKLIGRDKTTIERWRMKGAAGQRGYARLYYDMEVARGHSLVRLHLFTNQKAMAAGADGRLALALLDRHDPEFRELRSIRARGEATAEVVVATGAVADGGVAKAAARITYKLSWEDDSPVNFPGLQRREAPIEVSALQPGGNGGRPSANDDEDAEETG